MWAREHAGCLHTTLRGDGAGTPRCLDHDVSLTAAVRCCGDVDLSSPVCLPASAAAPPPPPPTGNNSTRTNSTACNTTALDRKVRELEAAADKTRAQCRSDQQALARQVASLGRTASELRGELNEAEMEIGALKGQLAHALDAKPQLCGNPLAGALQAQIKDLVAHALASNQQQVETPPAQPEAAPGFGSVRACPRGTVYKTCGSHCDNLLTCAKAKSGETPFCSRACVSGCFCPPGKPIRHNGRCIAQSECPAKSDAEVAAELSAAVLARVQQAAHC